MKYMFSDKIGQLYIYNDLPSNSPQVPQLRTYQYNLIANDYLIIIDTMI